jgi:ABC-type molybdate transport system ATPase subunit
MGNIHMTYFLDRSDDGKVSKVHWHVAGTNERTKKMSLVMQKVWNGQLDNSPGGIIQLIVANETLRLQLNHSQMKSIRNELQDTIHVQKIICYGGCS